MKQKCRGRKPSEYVYRCEGNSSVVVWDNQSKRIFRLSKRMSQEGSRKKKKLTLFPAAQRATLCVDYIRHVVAPLFHPCFVPDQGLIEMESSFVDQISDIVTTYRPRHRLASSIDSSQTSVMFMDDCCFVREPKFVSNNSTFAIEIKPKCGYLPRTSSACQFCMLQYHKVKEGRVKQRSEYCPIDLYSGDRQRMRRAFDGLLKTPQNNLRIFKDGFLVFSEENKCDLNDILEESGVSDEDFFDVLLKALMYSPASHQEDTHCNKEEEGQVLVIDGAVCSEQVARMPYTSKPEVCENSSSCLPEGCVLHALLKAQRMHDLDIGTIHHLYQNLLKVQLHTDSEAFNLQGPFTPETWNIMDTDENKLPDSISYMVLKVQQYLVSRTVRDCSVMVAFQPYSKSGTPPPTEPNSPCFFIETELGLHCQASVAIIDMDPKPPHKIPTYHREETDILAYYLQQVTSRLTKS